MSKSYDIVRPAGPVQLSLLEVRHLPRQLRVSPKTRKIGRQGIAEARAILAEQAARRAQRSGQTAA